MRFSILQLMWFVIAIACVARLGIYLRESQSISVKIASLQSRIERLNNYLGEPTVHGPDEACIIPTFVPTAMALETFSVIRSFRIHLPKDQPWLLQLEQSQDGSVTQVPHEPIPFAETGLITCTVGVSNIDNTPKLFVKGNESTYELPLKRSEFHAIFAERGATQIRQTTYAKAGQRELTLLQCKTSSKGPSESMNSSDSATSVNLRLVLKPASVR